MFCYIYCNEQFNSLWAGPSILGNVTSQGSAILGSRSCNDHNRVLLKNLYLSQGCGFKIFEHTPLCFCYSTLQLCIFVNATVTHMVNKLPPITLDFKVYLWLTLQRNRCDVFILNHHFSRSAFSYYY